MMTLFIRVKIVVWDNLGVFKAWPQGLVSAFPMDLFIIGLLWDVPLKQELNNGGKTKASLSMSKQLLAV